ncbi:keratin 70 L homeolog isoform X1 [Xenopus laevis]|uniref:Keratin 70 L homeolog isoform X1 n=1 Tax=Xenopus laevis TaxID=8355 RepID=A0A8J1LRU2_XENLA|nr:keratin 70 L homeolog isoform X1 [Xenopus laevis]
MSFGVFASPGVNRARSVAGGASTVRMSSANMTSSAFAASPAFEVGVTSNNGKETMQNLNDRLSNYLERVRSLELANHELERKIREYLDKKAAVGSMDVSGYYKTINLLRSQINDATIDNTRLVLSIDNAKLAADDFKIKYESELAIRTGAESDIAGLRRVLDELTLNKTDLELDIESLKEELIYLKKSHEEELAVVRSSAKGNVDVQVDSAPPVDLAQIMTDVRAQYESMMEKNRQEVEAWYRGQSENLNKEVAINTTALQTSKSEITDLKRTIQSLEIELQSLLSMKNALEGTLAETEARYGSELNHLQAMITQVELEMQNLRSDAERQSFEYKLLLDIKTRLEMEIATYRRLLEGEDNRFSQTETQKDVTIISKEQTKSSIKKVKTVIEEVVDGKVVSSRVEEMTEKL